MSYCCPPLHLRKIYKTVRTLQETFHSSNYRTGRAMVQGPYRGGFPNPNMPSRRTKQLCIRHATAQSPEQLYKQVEPADAITCYACMQSCLAFVAPVRPKNCSCNAAAPS